MEENKQTMDAALAFFDDVFEKVPAAYRQVDPSYNETQHIKSKKKSKEKGVSLANLNEKAQARIAEIQRINREKSQKKIKELTKQHQEQKNSKNAKAEEASDEEMKEEPQKSSSVNGNKYKNKNQLAASKLQNKRTQKEALKKNKMKRQKGVQKTVAGKQSDVAESGSDKA